MKIETAWVKPPLQIGGLDHLAVQAPCINIYGRLLPGITNVTDRARYYSFYPWLVWSFDQQGFTKYDDDWVERFRRADCLFTLIATRHAAQAGGEYEDHAGATIGSRTLNPVARDLGKGEGIKLSDYSRREGAKVRYFQNKLGGLGQYYLGILRELKVLGGASATGIQYTRQFGQKIAESFDAGVDRDAFFAVVDADFVAGDQLDALNLFCPCNIRKNPGELKILSEVFFAQNGFYETEALPRRRTLQSILDLSALLADEGKELNIATFRACFYSSALPSGKQWACSASLLPNREKWAIYARSELLSIAVQGVFYALLDAYEESGLRFASGAILADWFATQPELDDLLQNVDSNKKFSNLVEESASWLPGFSEWSSENHEIELTNQVYELCQGAKTKEVRGQIMLKSLGIIIALAARSVKRDKPYGELVFEKSYFLYYPINLISFQYHVAETWASMTSIELLKWLLTNWGVDQHMRVALRKLRGQSQSTFRIRPSDLGLEVISVPGAAHTSPRFYQSMRILKDIGALEQSKDGFWVPSGLGKSILEQGDAP